MFKFRIRYKNQWQDEMSIVYETESYRKVFEMAKNHFGAKNIIEIVPLDEQSAQDKQWYDAITKYDDMA